MELWIYFNCGKCLAGAVKGALNTRSFDSVCLFACRCLDYGKAVIPAVDDRITGLASRDLVADEAWYHCQCYRDYAGPDKAFKYSDLNDEPDSDETNYCNIESQAYEKTV